LFRKTRSFRKCGHCRIEGEAEDYCEVGVRKAVDELFIYGQGRGALAVPRCKKLPKGKFVHFKSQNVIALIRPNLDLP